MYIQQLIAVRPLCSSLKAALIKYRRCCEDEVAQQVDAAVPPGHVCYTLVNVV